MSTGMWFEYQVRHECLESMLSLNISQLQHVDSLTSNNLLSLSKRHKKTTENVDEINLKDVLKFTVGGRTLWMKGTALFMFNDDDRSELADILIGHEISKGVKKRLCLQRLEYFADKIAKTFCFENTETWLQSVMSGPNNILARGKLITRYNTWVKVAKLAPLEIKRDSYHVSIETDVEENCKLQVSLAYLRNLAEPWATVEELWKNTQETRMEYLNAVNESIYDYFNLYPCLKESLGFKLLEKDFEYLYPAAKGKLFAEWPKFLSFVEIILKEKQLGLFDESKTPDGRTMRLLMRVSGIFPVVTAIRKIGIGSWKPSLAESQDAFFLVIQGTQLLQPILQMRSEKLSRFGLSLQPLLVAMGSEEGFSRCFVILDTATYELDTPLQAIDAAFKIFHSLRIPYPPECEQIWTFLQRAVYGIRTDKDDRFPACSELVAKYDRFDASSRR